MVWNFYISVAKGLKIKFRKFGWEIPKFPEVTGEKWYGTMPILMAILNRVKILQYQFR